MPQVHAFCFLIAGGGSNLLKIQFNLVNPVWVERLNNQEVYDPVLCDCSPPPLGEFSYPLATQVEVVKRDIL